MSWATPAPTRCRRSLRAILAAACCLLIAMSAGCSTNPATGKRQLNLLSRSEEIAIGEESMPQLIDTYGGEVPLAGPRAYVREIGHQLARQTEGENPSLPWEFTLLNSDVINAFALPGGKVFITRELVERMDSEAQLAAVLGHEVGHVTARHANEQITNQLIVSGIIVGASVAATQGESDLVKYGVPALVAGGSGLFILKFGRDDELESDRLGMRYLAAAGYDPAAMLDVMRILDEASQGGDRGPEWLSTHPLPRTRVDQAMNELARGTFAPPPPGGYRIGSDAFHNRMLQPLSTLPPALSPSPPSGESSEGG